jgi:type IV secretory pathway VirB10-like protein
MAKARRKLKVFQAQFGFYDSVVAAQSRWAALRAWGVHQNLFSSGEATLATDEAAIAAAILNPETPLRRAIGSNDPFALEPTSLPQAPEPPEGKAMPATRAPEPAVPPKPPADRSKLDAAEKALKALDVRRKREEAKLRQEADELEARREAAQDAYVQARQTAEAALAEARGDYAKAAGED